MKPDRHSFANARLRREVMRLVLVTVKVKGRLRVMAKARETILAAFPAWRWECRLKPVRFAVSLG